jgi:hypothetical protein
MIMSQEYIPVGNRGLLEIVGLTYFATAFRIGVWNQDWEATLCLVRYFHAGKCWFGAVAVPFAHPPRFCK